MLKISIFDYCGVDLNKVFLNTYFFFDAILKNL